MSTIIKDPVIVHRAYQKVQIMNFHNHLTDKALSSDGIFEADFGTRMEFTGDLILLKDYPGGPIVITYPMLLSVLDKVEAHFSWEYCLDYVNSLPANVGKDYKELFMRLYEVLEKNYQSHGNEAVRLFKLLEPLMVGVSLEHLPKDTNDHSLLPEVSKSLDDTAPQLKEGIEEVIQIANDHLMKHGPQSIPHLLEQVGQEKLHFYPIVSVEGGMKKMFKHGTSYRPTEDSAARELANNMKREYMVAYYEFHKRLPKFQEHFQIGPGIAEIIKKGRPGSIRECYNIPDSEWENLEYLQNHTFNYYPQVSDLLDDKAITPNLVHVYQLFAEDALKVIGKKKEYEHVNTRLILEILNRKEIDIREFYAELESQGFFPLNWAVIQLMPKERELKIEARLFSILTFKCRMMASCCERNIGEQLLKLFKQQSMTLSGSQLRQKMDILSTLPESKDYIWVRFHMDLEQWNYTFRSHQQWYFVELLDKLFGVKHYSYIVRLFVDSLLISANRFTPPGMPDEFTGWGCHAGGNQGILQKLWTLITIMIIRGVMHRGDFDHRLTGSGDNQVLFVKMRKGPDLLNRIGILKQLLKEGFEKVGLSLKIFETWFSSIITCYQRKYYFLGILISSVIKQSGRAFSGEGDINCGLNSMVSTAVNGGLSISEQSYDPVIGIGFTLLEIMIVLLCDNRFSQMAPQDDNTLVRSYLLSFHLTLASCPFNNYPVIYMQDTKTL